MSLANQDLENDGELANALSGYQEKFKDVFSGTAPISTTWKKKDLTGLSGKDIQQDVNQAVVKAREEYSPVLYKEQYGGDGKSFGAGAARGMASEAGAAMSNMLGADVTKRFGHDMQNYLEKLSGHSKMSDEANQLAAWLINRGQSNRDLQFGLQNINASLYASQLATQMAMAGVPLDMISSLLSGLGGLGGGGLLAGAFDPVTQALQGA